MSCMFTFYLQIFTDVQCAQCVHVYTKNLLPSYWSVHKGQRNVTYGRIHRKSDPCTVHMPVLNHNYVSISNHSTGFLPVILFIM